MKIHIEKKQVDGIFQIFWASVFFVIAGIVFFAYSIDISPLVFGFFLLLYAKYFKKLEVSISVTDLFILVCAASWQAKSFGLQ